MPRSLPPHFIRNCMTGPLLMLAATGSALAQGKSTLSLADLGLPADKRDA